MSFQSGGLKVGKAVNDGESLNPVLKDSFADAGKGVSGTPKSVKKTFDTSRLKANRTTNKKNNYRTKTKTKKAKSTSKVQKEEKFSKLRNKLLDSWNPKKVGL